jgi:hypothetical protein
VFLLVESVLNLSRITSDSIYGPSKPLKRKEISPTEEAAGKWRLEAVRPEQTSQE